MSFDEHADSLVLVQYGNLFDLAALLYARRPSGRTVVVAHCGPTWRHQRTPLGRWLVRWLLNRADCTIALSREQETTLRELGVRVVKRSPTLIGPSLEAPPLPTSRPPYSMIFAGRVSREKGVDDAIRLAAALTAMKLEPLLSICGPVDPDYAEAFASRVQRARDQGARIDILGEVEPHLVPALLRQHAYLVYPSRQDAYPLALLEALASGCFPLAYDLPGTREIVEEFAGHLEPLGHWRGLAAPVQQGASAVTDWPSIQSALRLRFGGSELFADIAGALDERG